MTFKLVGEDTDKGRFFKLVGEDTNKGRFFKLVGEDTNKLENLLMKTPKKGVSWMLILPEIPSQPALLSGEIRINLVFRP